tara:strand:+ start:3708 stop:4646 length:939 start_codon:yes stop_codon:yes gene_type:complete
MLLLIIVVIFINYYYFNTSTLDNPSHNSGSLGFVKPEHRLYNIFSKISSSSKIKLNGKCVKYIYNKNTINVEVKENIISLLTKIIDTIKYISNQEYFIKTVENVYCSVGRNQRYIVDFFLFDVKNYYTIRLIADLVIIDGEIYINYMNTQNGSNPILLNNYDVKFNSSGILFDANMFHENIEELLNKYYSSDYHVISVDNNSSLEYTPNDLSKVYTINTMKNLYFPTTVSNKTLEDYNNKGLAGLNENYLTPKQNTINSKTICNDRSCVLKNTSTQNRINEPYDAPGVIYTRSSDDKYKWLKEGSGTIYNLL